MALSLSACAAGNEKSDAKSSSSTKLSGTLNGASPSALVFNLEGVDKLQLSPATAAQIFAGKITTWDDPAIKADNPGAKLPSDKITPVHRSDDSGTTNNFTDYLHQTAPKDWSAAA